MHELLTIWEVAAIINVEGLDQWGCEGKASRRGHDHW
jgi:hypothetical protein